MSEKTTEKTTTPKTEKTIELKLMGQRIVLKTQAESDRADEVTKLVKARIEMAEQRLKTGAAPQYSALLALFDLAEEYIEAKKRVARHQAEVRTTAQSLGRMFDIVPPS
jgi:hypothetical protein